MARPSLPPPGASDAARAPEVARPWPIPRWVALVVVLVLPLSALWLAFQGGGVLALHWAAVAVVLGGLALALGASAMLPGLAGTPWPAFAGPAALIALAGWAALSVTWSASPTFSVEAAGRLTLAALVLGIATWVARGTGAPLAAVAGVIGVSLIAALAVLTRLLGSDAEIFASDRLAYPISYANGTAALLAVGAPAALALAAERRLAWAGRAALAGVAAILVAATLLAVSRGALAALAVALVVLAVGATARMRGRLVGMALAVAVGVAAAWPLLFSGAEVDAATARDRGLGLLVAGVLAAGLGAVLAGADRRLAALWRRRPVRLGTAALALVLVLAAAASLIGRVGNPATAAGEAWSEFTAPSPAVAGNDGVGSRLGSAQSNRAAYWRVAVEEWADAPLIGTGAGTFRITWQRERPITESVADAHGWPFELGSELGLVGAALFGAFALALAAAARAARRQPGWRGTAGIAALGSASYFVVHAGVDWLLQIPAVLVLGLLAAGALLGAAGPAAPGLGGRRSGAGAAVLAALALALVLPLWVSERHLARGAGALDPTRAVAELRTAERWNPVSIAPLSLEAEVRLGAGDLAGAERALREAIQAEPTRFEPWQQLRDVYLAAGLTEAAAAAERRLDQLNPFWDGG